MRRVSWASTRSLSRSRVSAAAAQDGGLGDLVEDHPADRDLRLERLEQVPGDRLALAVGVGGEVELVGVLEQALELGDLGLLVRADDVERLEVVVDVDAEPRPRLDPCTWPARRRHRAAGHGCGPPRPRRCSCGPGRARSCGPWSATRRSRDDAGVGPDRLNCGLVLPPANTFLLDPRVGRSARCAAGADGDVRTSPPVTFIPCALGGNPAAIRQCDGATRSET